MLAMNKSAIVKNNVNQILTHCIQIGILIAKRILTLINSFHMLITSVKAMVALHPRPKVALTSKSF